jgi:hypothetical protein
MSVKNGRHACTGWLPIIRLGALLVPLSVAGGLCLEAAADPVAPNHATRGSVLETENGSTAAVFSSCAEREIVPEWVRNSDGATAAAPAPASWAETAFAAAEEVSFEDEGLVARDRGVSWDGTAAGEDRTAAGEAAAAGDPAGGPPVGPPSCKGNLGGRCKLICIPEECPPCYTLDCCGCCRKKIPGCKP